MSYEYWDRQLDTYQKAVATDLVGLTAARIAIGSASRSERLGYRFPWLFRKWARENAERDETSRALHRQMRELSERGTAGSPS